MRINKRINRQLNLPAKIYFKTHKFSLEDEILCYQLITSVNTIKIMFRNKKENLLYDENHIF